MPATLVDDLRARAAAEDETETAIVRRALEAYLHPESAPITKDDLATFFEQMQRSIEAVKVEALPTPEQEETKPKKGFLRRLFAGD